MKFIFALCLFLFSTLCHAWGERGHDLVTRVAVKQLQLGHDYGAALTQPFIQRDHLLSHLSNAPDFHWRANYMPWHLRGLNSPTHYIGMESVYDGLTELSELDTSIEYFYQQARKNGHENPAKVGTAPWRVLQLYNLMTDSLKSAKRADDRFDMIEATNQALFYAGLMSHFVGDLANPHHTTVNHDGQYSGNTGLHAYFEDHVVRALPMSLASDVGLAAPTALEAVLLSTYEPTHHETILGDPTKLIFALVLNSFSKVDALHELDDQHSIIEPSTDEENDAVRKPASETMEGYRTFITERLSLGASVLAQLWKLSWLEAGQPDLSEFHSYRYFPAPEFIAPDYLR